MSWGGFSLRKVRKVFEDSKISHHVLSETAKRRPAFMFLRFDAYKFTEPSMVERAPRKFRALCGRGLVTGGEQFAQVAARRPPAVGVFRRVKSVSC
jgi:hypothetical protein